MSDDEADLELLELLRKSLGLGPPDANAPPDTRVLSSAEYIYDNSIDVALDMQGHKIAAEKIWQQMQIRSYDTKAWSKHELHPKRDEFGDEGLVNFVFTMDLLNFCFWSEKDEKERFQIEYCDRRWTGYWSLVAALRRALDEGIPITTPSYWADEDQCTEDVVKDVFRSATEEEIPLLTERIAVMREAGRILVDEYDGSVLDLIASADRSARRLVNTLADRFPCFNDTHRFEGRTVRILKRAQILVADLWAAFEMTGPGEFDDIEHITMFADYRIPQTLIHLNCLVPSPPLARAIRNRTPIPSGSSWELQIRGNSIHSVELLRREIIAAHPEAKGKVNAILIDFFLYDLAKEMEQEALAAQNRKEEEMVAAEGWKGGKAAREAGKGVREGEEVLGAEGLVPHHRTRSIWY